MQVLFKESMQIDALARKLKIPAAQLGAAISMLQLEGCITEEQGKLYVV